MDPFTISAAVAPLVVSSVKLAMVVNAIKTSYQNAPITLISASTESNLMHACLCKIQGLVYRNEGHLSAQLRSQKHLTEAFDQSLSGCRMTLDALNCEVIKLVEPNQNGDKVGRFEMGFRAKARLVWNEDVMKRLLDHTRGQINSLECLISILETETQDEILRLLKKNTAAIHKMYSKARSIRSAQGVEDEESSFSWSQTSIAYNLSHSFDEELAGSSAYQKAQEAAAEDLFAQRLKLLEEKFALEEKLDDLRLEMDLKEEEVAKLQRQIQNLSGAEPMNTALVPLTGRPQAPISSPFNSGPFIPANSTIPNGFSEIDTTFCYLVEYCVPNSGYRLVSRNSSVLILARGGEEYWHFIRINTKQYALVSNNLDWAATVASDRFVRMSKLSSETSYLGQLWMFTPLPDGTYHMTNNNSGFNRLICSDQDLNCPYKMPTNIDKPVPTNRQWNLVRTKLRARTLNAPPLN